MTEPKYKIGQPVWVARTTRVANKVLCPVCFGKKVVVLILGDDSQVELECDNCSKGFMPPTGHVDGDWQWKARVDEAGVITGVRVDTSKDKTEVLYWFNQGGGCTVGHNEEDLGVTYEETLSIALEHAIKRQTEENRKAREEKEKPHKSYSWHVGYHLRKAAQASAEYTRHTEKAKFMETKVRKPKEVT